MDKLYNISIDGLIKKYNMDVKNKKRVPYKIFDEEMSKNEIMDIINQNGIIIIPAYFYNEYIEDIIEDKNYRSVVIYPVQKGLELYNKKISTTYVCEKFKIYEKYIFLDRFHGKENIIKDIKNMTDDDINLKIVVIASEKNLSSDILEKIDFMGLTEEIIFLEIESSQDLINLINGAEMVINLESEERLNYNLINAICLNKLIICDANQLNYELLENYPYYFNNSIKINSLINKNDFCVKNRRTIIHKFLEETNLIELKNRVDGELYEI